MAEMQIGRRWIEAYLYDERLAGFRRSFEFRSQLCLSDDVDAA